MTDAVKSMKGLAASAAGPWALGVFVRWFWGLGLGEGGCQLLVGFEFCLLFAVLWAWEFRVFTHGLEWLAVFLNGVIVLAEVFQGQRV